MSKMFDYITKGGDKVAELEASLEHMGGHLEIELEEADKLRAEIAKLRAALEEIIRCYNYEVAYELIEIARKALANEQLGEDAKWLTKTTTSKKTT